MDLEISDPRFREAVAAIDAGDIGALRRLLAAHPELVRERADCGEGYFHRPYLLWFVAENPVRNDRLPANIGQIARTLIEELERQAVESRRAQLDYTLELVCSGRVPREQGVQRELIDLLVGAGADPDSAMLCCLAHRELDAAERLLDHGAILTLTAAVCTGRRDEIGRLAAAAAPEERGTAFAAAALYGDVAALTLLLGLGAEPAAHGPPGFHAHATALHHAVESGSLAAVKLLVEAGADLGKRDLIYHATPLGWAEHLDRGEIAGYLREQGAPGGGA
jgi:peptide-methionine (S)-S-oxide reductase